MNAQSLIFMGLKFEYSSENQLITMFESFAVGVFSDDENSCSFHLT